MGQIGQMDGSPLSVSPSRGEVAVAGNRGTGGTKGV